MPTLRWKLSALLASVFSLGSVAHSGATPNPGAANPDHPTLRSEGAQVPLMIVAKNMAPAMKRPPKKRASHKPKSG